MRNRILIIGQGLAGSVLALELRTRGCDVTVIDDIRAGSASPVAAGMFNPMSFRRIIPVWRANEVMAAMVPFYLNAETELGACFFHRVPLVKIFANNDYAALWQQRINEGLHWVSRGPELHAEIKAPYGCGQVSSAGFVELNLFMRALASRLSADGRLHRVAFHEDYLTATAEGVTYHDVELDLRLSADALVLATGTFARGTKLLGELPLQTNKGEVLTVRSDLNAAFTLNNGKWLLPVGDGTYRLGASYLPGADDDHLTGEVATQLLEKAALMVTSTLNVVEHRAGLRPTVPDHRALLGQSGLQNVYHFNGMGTRGVLNAPLLAQYMADHLINGIELPEEVDVQRFR